MLAVEDGKIRSWGARENRAEILLCHQQTIDVRDRQNFVLLTFEAHLSEVTFGTCLPSKTGRSVPVEQGKIVPRYFLTNAPICGRFTSC